MTSKEREKQAREVLKFLNGGNVPVVLHTMNKTYAVLSSSLTAFSWWFSDAETGMTCAVRVFQWENGNGREF